MNDFGEEIRAAQAETAAAVERAAAQAERRVARAAAAKLLDLPWVLCDLCGSDEWTEEWADSFARSRFWRCHECRNPLSHQEWNLEYERIKLPHPYTSYPTRFHLRRRPEPTGGHGYEGPR
jgi:hypothetical protein